MTTLLIQGFVKEDDIQMIGLEDSPATHEVEFPACSNARPFLFAHASPRQVGHLIRNSAEVRSGTTFQPTLAGP